MATQTAITPVPGPTATAAGTCPTCGAGVVARLNVMARLIYFDCTACSHYTTVPIHT